MTKKIYGLIGHPVRHSLSPAMHNAAFAACGIDAEYKIYDVSPSELEQFLRNIREKGISGVNVTIPHKIEARNFLERSGSIDDNARRLGAVNTIKVMEDGRLLGSNTDGPGFYTSLVEDLKFEPEGKSVFVLGAGGAATAIVMYLGKAPRKIFISDVDKKKTKDLIDRYEKYYGDSRIAAADEKDLKASLDSSELLINATPVGMKEGDPSPVKKEMMHTGLRVYDMVYNRPVTELVREANSLKLHAVNGLGMLLYQGAIAFESWTGIKAPVAVMRRALKEAMKVNG